MVGAQENRQEREHFGQRRTSEKKNNENGNIICCDIRE